jgi:hypothetical protein
MDAISGTFWIRGWRSAEVLLLDLLDREEEKAKHNV